MTALAHHQLHRRRPLLLAAFVAILAALVLTLFAWPQADSGPRNVPIGVAGGAHAVAALERGIAQGEQGFDVTRYADGAAAREAIEDREVYGAIVAAPDGTTLLTAPAASPAVAQLLEQALVAGGPSTGEVRGAPAEGSLSGVELVPGSPEDPRGAAFGASILPLILLGIVTGALGWMLGGGVGRSLAFLVGASALAGLAAVAVIQGWLGVIEGGWPANAGVLALLLLAISATAAGLVRLLGYPGLGVAALLFVLIGNPWSGISSAPELLPRPVGAIGQLLPPGAGGELLRGTAFFDGSGTTGALVVLVVWTAVGLGLLRWRARGAMDGVGRRTGGGVPAAAQIGDGARCLHSSRSTERSLAHADRPPASRIAGQPQRCGSREPGSRSRIRSRFSD